MTATRFKRFPAVLAPIVRPDGGQVGAHFTAQLLDLLNSVRATDEAWTVPSAALQDLILQANQSQEGDVPFLDLIQLMLSKNDEHAQTHNESEGSPVPSHPPSMAGLHRHVRAQLRDIAVLVQVSPGSLAFQIPETDLKSLLAGESVSFNQLLEGMIRANDARRGTDQPWRQQIKPVPENPQEFFVTQSTIEDAVRESSLAKADTLVEIAKVAEKKKGGGEKRPSLRQNEDASTNSTSRPTSAPRDNSENKDTNNTTGTVQPRPPSAPRPNKAAPHREARDERPVVKRGSSATSRKSNRSHHSSVHSDVGSDVSLIFDVHLDPHIEADSDDGVLKVHLDLELGKARKRESSTRA